MPERTSDLASLVRSLLPYDHDTVDIDPEGELEIGDLMAASIAAFSVASIYTFAKNENFDRRLFCRRTAALSDGYLKAWMVEAALCNIDGQENALAGINSHTMRFVPLVGLDLLSSHYLTTFECLRLRQPAVERAVQIRPDILVIRWGDQE